MRRDFSLWSVHKEGVCERGLNIFTPIANSFGSGERCKRQMLVQLGETRRGSAIVDETHSSAGCLRFSSLRAFSSLRMSRDGSPFREGINSIMFDLAQFQSQIVFSMELNR